MKWLLGVVCVVALSCGGDESNCFCDSILSVSIADIDFAVLEQGPTVVRLCLDDECHSIAVDDVNGSASNNDGYSVTFDSHPARLVFVSKQKYVKATQNVKLEFMRLSQVLVSHTWLDVAMTQVSAFSLQEGQTCSFSCESAQIN
jgi:hypothetical protein